MSVDPTNRVNTFISYYSWGAFLGLALDLTLRSREDGATRDDFMRALWRRHGRPLCYGGPRARVGRGLEHVVYICARELSQ